MQFQNRRRRMKAKGVILIRKPHYECSKRSTDRMEQRMGTYVKPHDQREEYHDPDESEYEEGYLSEGEDKVRVSFLP